MSDTTNYILKSEMFNTFYRILIDFNCVISSTQKIYSKLNKYLNYTNKSTFNCNKQLIN